MIRSGKRYSIGEILYLFNELERRSPEELAFQVLRSPKAIVSKFSLPTLEAGATSLRGIKQYNSIEEIFRSFGEKYLGPEDVEKRIEEFREKLKEFTYANTD
jgi:hypothetical protein